MPSAAGSDIILALLPSSKARTSHTQYRIIGGTLDMYFYSCLYPKNIVEHYWNVVGDVILGFRMSKLFSCCRN